MKTTEAQEARAFKSFMDVYALIYPEAALCYHVPNEGRRDARTGANLKAQGMKAGVPDYCLPVPRRGFHGLYIELKREGGRVSKTQKEYLAALQAQGYQALVCCGWEEAARAVKEYLEGAS